MVQKMPTLIVSGFLAMSAIQSLFVGLILNAHVESARKQFENNMQVIHMDLTRKING